MKKLFKNLKTLGVRLKNSVKNAIYIKDIKCIACSRELDAKNKYCMCSKCLSKLPYSVGNKCFICGTSVLGDSKYCLNCKDNKHDYTCARAPFVYEGTIKRLIYRLKYLQGKYLAPYLSYFLLDEFSSQNWSVDCVVVVPLHPKRQKSRGFNQAELLSRHFEQYFNLPIILDNLIRVSDTPYQARLTKNERATNLTKAFKIVDKKAFKDKNILLIDDVFTTGATAEECSKVLKKAGAKNIYVLTLAHVRGKVATE